MSILNSPPVWNHWDEVIGWEKRTTKSSDEKGFREYDHLRWPEKSIELKVTCPESVGYYILYIDQRESL